MKKTLVVISILLYTCIGCQTPRNTYLVKFASDDFEEIGTPTGYLNEKGDTIIPIGKYYYCYTDTITNFGIVIENNSHKLLGIDKHENVLFEIFRYDNGPDYTSNGLFRIVKDEKIGYANEKGVIVITPKYAFAQPFKGDSAKVSTVGTTVLEGEHSTYKNVEWYYINKNGEKLH